LFPERRCRADRGDRVDVRNHADGLTTIRLSTFVLVSSPAALPATVASTFFVLASLLPL
jgi:hypothetical protein